MALSSLPVVTNSGRLRRRHTTPLSTAAPTSVEPRVESAADRTEPKPEAAVISVDLSMRMLQQANGRSSWRVKADASRLPLADASVAVIAAIDMLLFPAETARVLAPGGVLLWINQLGCDGPLYLPAATVVAALPGTWQATESEAGWGSWAVLRRTR